MNFMSNGSKINFDIPSKWRMIESSSGQGEILNSEMDLWHKLTVTFFKDLIVFIKWFMNGAASYLATRKVLSILTF